MKLSLSILAAAIGLSGCVSAGSSYDATTAADRVDVDLVALARAMDYAEPSCVLTREKWEPVFESKGLTTPLQKADAVNVMVQRDMLVYFEKKQAVLMLKPYCREGAVKNN